MEAKSTTADSTPFDDGELYDTICAGFTYGIDFYVDLARQARGPVLDVCCGTGRILLPCAQAGTDVDGLDLAPAMLATLKKKAAALGLATRVYAADMSDFTLPRPYALVMITFNAFIHNLTQEAQIRCLERCRQHLAPGGMLAFDTFFPGAAIICGDTARVLELETQHPCGLPMRAYDTRTFHRVEQIQHSVYEIELVHPDGIIETIHRSEYRTRYIYKEEMALLLRAAGFTRWEILGGFDRRQLTQETDAMIVLAYAD